ncbi:hypothetical protein [Bdellovibrio sp.]|uniref:hypothetical protein n=1 Tax=Bdellovibrio sp. TaxID=28201 RepID=UPI0039E5B209
MNVKVQIRHAAILRQKEKGRFDVLSKEEMSDYFLMGELLSFSATVTRDLLGWTYAKTFGAIFMKAFFAI